MQRNLITLIKLEERLFSGGPNPLLKGGPYLLANLDRGFQIRGGGGGGGGGSKSAGCPNPL